MNIWELLQLACVLAVLCWIIGGLDRLFPALFRSWKGPQRSQKSAPRATSDKLRFKPVEERTAPEEPEHVRVYRHQKELAQNSRK